MATIALAAQARTAHACSCAAGSLEGSVAGSDAIFVGTVQAIEHPFGQYGSGARVAVEAYWKGEVPATVFLVAGEHKGGGLFSLSACELGLDAGDRYLFFAQTRGRFLAASVCSGTQAFGTRDWRPDRPPPNYVELVRQYGPGAPPSANLTPQKAPTTRPPRNPHPTPDPSGPPTGAHGPIPYS
jgi:hypothetical protein